MFTSVIRVFMLVSLLVATTASAQLTNLECGDALYGASQAGELFTVDLDTAMAELVAVLPGAGTTEIEYDILGDTLFLETAGAARLFEVDPADGSPMRFAEHLSGDLDGLEFVGSTLYGTFFNGATTQLVVVDTEAGTFFSIGDTGIKEPVSGLAFQPHYGILYGITSDSGRLLTFDFDDGRATVLGSLDASGIGALELGPDGRLYAGLTATAPVFATGLVIIDPETVTATPVGLTGFSITGLTSCRTFGGVDEGAVAVPGLSPVGIVVLSLVLLFAGAWVMRRR